MTAEKPDPKAPNQQPDKVRVSTVVCVRCGQPVHARYRPFCSQRCADADLGSWFRGNYRLPTTEEPDPGEFPAPPDPDDRK